MEDTLEKAHELLYNVTDLITDKKYDEALLEVEKVEAIANLYDSRDALELRALCCQCRSNAYTNLGKTEENREIKEKNREIKEKIIEIRSSLDYSDDKAKRDANNAWLSSVLGSLGQLEKAMEYAEKVLESCSGDKGFDTGMRLFAASRVFMHDMDKNHEKVKGILILSRKNLMYGFGALMFPRLHDIQMVLAEIAFKYDNDAMKAQAELEKGWTFAQKLGFENCSPYSLFDIADAGIKYSEKVFRIDISWPRRLLQVFGLFIDTGEGGYDMGKLYVAGNISVFLNDMTMNESVTVERALRWLEVTKQQTQDAREIALAQWLAGLALVHKGKTPEDDIKGIGLIETSIKALRVTKADVDLDASDVYLDAVSVGEDCIARCYFNRKEFELAEVWFRAAIKDLKKCGTKTKSRYRKRFAEGLEICLLCKK
jgi:tetratricopeptide (TPR) repeat protein